MPIQNLDQLIGAIYNGQSAHTDWCKTLNYPANFADTSQGFGMNGNNSVIGSTTNLAHQSISDTTSTTATTAAASGSISGQVFTDTTHNTGRFTIGMYLSGAGIDPSTQITSLGTGTGANNGGTYNINISQTVNNVTITGTGYSNGIPHGGNVSPAVKNLTYASLVALNPASANSGPFTLYDMLACYTISSVTTTTTQSFTGQTAWPRYANGVGVRAFLVQTIAAGTGSPTFKLNYTNTASVSGQVTPAIPSLPLAANSTPFASITNSSTNNARLGAFFPLAPGDTGMLSVQSITISATMTSGCMALVICKPLLTLQTFIPGVMGEKDLVNQWPSMPIIYDGACLNWISGVLVGAPGTVTYYGSIETAWL